ncbi:MAG: B12-binding domain-containing radical SAM protein [Bryobacteraceae bacterium]
MAASRATDIVFMFPPAQGNLGAFRAHLGVSYLRAALAQEGMASVQYLNSRPGTVDEIASGVLDLNPGVVGFTVYDANYALSVALARTIKRKRPAVRVVFGGPSASFCAEHILERQSAVDACVLGEAEETGARIFTKLLDESGLDERQPGIAFRRDGEVVCTGMPPLVGLSCRALPAQCALDSTPSPYLSATLTDGRAGILSGRGCTHHCQYCCFAALGRKTLRLHSTERVLAELEWIAAHQKRTEQHYVVAVHDDAFTLSPTRAKNLCQAIAERNLGLLLSCITRADALDEELIRTMRDAGFVGMAFGLESAVPSVLRATGKVRPPEWPDPDLEPEREFLERVRTSVVTAKKYGFNVGVSIILGLPTERAEDGAETLRFVKSLPVDYYMHNFLWVFPGTPLWETRERYGIRCEINSMGLGTTTEYAYDVAKLRPRPKCELEQDARVARLLATDTLYNCGAPGVESGGGIAAAIVRGTELTAPTAGWLSLILDVGGLVVQVYPPLKPSEKNLRLYCDRVVASENLLPARHHIQLLPRAGKNGLRRWTAACSGSDLYCAHKPELLTIRISDGPEPFRDWLEGRPTECSLCDVSEYLRHPDELLHFARETPESEIGARLRQMAAPPGIKYPGRWIRGKAPCLPLSRIEIEQPGEVRCCLHGEPIGAVGDSRQALTDRLIRFVEEAERRRGCATCPNTHCPRCPFPGVGDQEYCSLMSRQEQALNLLNWAHAYSRVPSILTLQRDRFGND